MAENHGVIVSIYILNSPNIILICQFSFAPPAVPHSRIQWRYLFPLLVCQAARVQLSFFSSIPHFTTVSCSCEYGFLQLQGLQQFSDEASGMEAALTDTKKLSGIRVANV